MLKKHPKISVAFFSLGFLFGLATIACAIVIEHGGGQAQERARHLLDDYLVFVCPASMGFMALDAPDQSVFHIIATYIWIVLFNAAIYGLIGTGIAKLWARLRRKEPEIEA